MTSTKHILRNLTRNSKHTEPGVQISIPNIQYVNVNRCTSSLLCILIEIDRYMKAPTRSILNHVLLHILYCQLLQIKIQFETFSFFFDFFSLYVYFVLFSIFVGVEKNTLIFMLQLQNSNSNPKM